MMQAEKWQKDLAVYRNINTTFIIEGNVHDLQPFLYEDDGSCEPVSLSLYLHRYLSAVGYDPVVFYNRIDGFSNPYALDMTASFFRTTGTSVPSVLLTEYPAPEALSSAKNPPAAGVLPGWRLSSVCSGCLFLLSWNGIRKREETRDMKKTRYTVFLILLICLDAALLLLPLLFKLTGVWLAIPAAQALTFCIAVPARRRTQRTRELPA